MCGPSGSNLEPNLFAIVGCNQFHLREWTLLYRQPFWSHVIQTDSLLKFFHLIPTDKKIHRLGVNLFLLISFNRFLAWGLMSHFLILQ